MDDRTYIRLHDGMPDHPKVVGLSDAAFRLYVESLCWCSRHLTDGQVPPAAMQRMGGWSPDTLDELASARLLENGSGPAWHVHDYTQHQRTAGQVAEAREVKRVAGVTGNHERWHVARGFIDPSCELCEIGDASHVRSIKDRNTESGVRSELHPDRSQETETDTEVKKKRLAQVGSDDDPDFTAFWAAYPRKIGKGQARKAWRSAIIGRRVEAKDVVIASERYRDAVRLNGTEPQYIPHPATWLNGERYNDAPEINESRPQRGQAEEYDWDA